VQPTKQTFPLRAWALWFIVLVGLAFGLWKRKVSTESVAPSPVAVTTTTTMTATPLAQPEEAIERSFLKAASETPAAVDSGALSERGLARAIAAARACVPALAAQPGVSNISSLSDMNRELTSALGGAGPREFGWMNAHVRDREGRETRLRIVGESTPDGKEALKFQVFALDEEGLPLPRRIPKEHAQHPSPEIVRQYMPSGSSLKFLEKGYGLNFADGAQARVIEAQGRVKDLEITSAQHILKCNETVTAGLSCACL
jgi:hypothetical protein